MMRRHYTLEEANGELPWLEEVFARAMPVRDELAARQRDLLRLLRVRRGNGAASKEQEIARAQRGVQELTGRLQRELRPIADKEIVLRDLSQGLVDFPSYREGREVFLCWRRGEESIGYWHETDTGFADRKPL